MLPTFIKMPTFSKFIFCLLFQIQLSASNNQSCQAKNYGYNSVVCICNATYCDEIGEIQSPAENEYAVYISSKSGQRFERTTQTITECSKAKYWMTVRSTEGIGMICSVKAKSTKQKIIGFGGSFTDAAGLNINSLSNEAKSKLLAAYFSPSGIEYNIGRIPLAATDFSTHFYTYQEDQNDLFTLTKEDTEDKIPLIRTANFISNRTILYFGSTWGAPEWMRDKNDFSTLDKTHYQAWADYFIKFMQNYKDNGIDIWGLTIQNEPLMSSFIEELVGNASYIFLTFKVSDYIDFTTNYFGPTIRNSEFSKVKIMDFDDTLNLLPIYRAIWSTQPPNNPCNEYVDGLAFHYYANKNINYYTILTGAHETCPDKFMLSTEACEGVQTPVRVQLGDWNRAENYAHDIIKSLQNWVGGWVDWNIALDTSGGPNWVNNFVDSPIIVNATADEFYKQPMFYAMGHFSKFLTPEFNVVDVTCGCPNDNVDIVAAVRNSTSDYKGTYNTVLVVLNRGDVDVEIDLEVSTSSKCKTNLCLNIPAYAIQTYIWNESHN